MASADTVSEITHWFELAVPKPAPKNQHTQLGVHFEEVGEMLDTLHAKTPQIGHLLDHARAAMTNLAAALKVGENLVEVPEELRAEFLDALCDQVVTATGCAHMFNCDMPGALDEVNESNWSKFVGGYPVFDENQKIKKGPRYFKPRLDSFVGV